MRNIGGPLSDPLLSTPSGASIQLSCVKNHIKPLTNPLATNLRLCTEKKHIRAYLVLEQTKPLLLQKRV